MDGWIGKTQLKKKKNWIQNVSQRPIEVYYLNRLIFFLILLFSTMESFYSCIYHYASISRKKKKTVPVINGPILSTYLMISS